MRKILFKSLGWRHRIVIYGCIGITTEVIFTAISSPSVSMAGHSYLWMVIVWPVGFYCLAFTEDKVRHYNVIFRALLYAVVCLAVEYAFGIFFRLVLGDIPWNYSYSYWHIDDAIRLDYIPFWGLAGLGAERIRKYLDKVSIKYG